MRPSDVAATPRTDSFSSLSACFNAGTARLSRSLPSTNAAWTRTLYDGSAISVRARSSILSAAAGPVRSSSTRTARRRQEGMTPSESVRLSDVFSQSLRPVGVDGVGLDQLHVMDRRGLQPLQLIVGEGAFDTGRRAHRQRSRRDVGAGGHQ